MIPRTFFTSDHHFGHRNIINLGAGRPFADDIEMGEALVARWNAVVRPEDVVWHLGDFAFKTSPARAKSYRDRLNGQIQFLQGNHDPEGWGRGVYVEIGPTPRLVLCHYPIEDWNGRYRGVLHLHGHTHSFQKWSARGRINVCVEARDYRPASLDEIVALAEANA